MRFVETIEENCKGNWSGVTPEESSVKLQSKNLSYTHLQENPQRLGWGSWGGMLHYIYILALVCSCPYNPGCQGPEFQGL